MHPLLLFRLHGTGLLAGAIITLVATPCLYGQSFDSEDCDSHIFKRDMAIVESPVQIPTDNRVYKSPDEDPQFPGGSDTLMKLIGNRIKYPIAAQKNGIQGRVVVQFVVTKTGEIDNVRVVRGKDPDLDKEAVRVVKTLPRFKPGLINGQPVNVWYTLPITFKLNEPQPAPATEQKEPVNTSGEIVLVEEMVVTRGDETPALSSDDRIYMAADEEPRFPGGQAALLKWVNEHIIYPKASMENNIQGRITVQFVVTETGEIGDVRVVRGKDPDLDREAVRVIKSLPKFTPGKMYGHAVKVWYTLPVTFRLQD